MSAYADTGFLCSVYAPDAHSERAIAWLETQTVPIWFSWLNQIEFRNALRLRVFRREITPRQRDASINHLLADLMAGFLQAADPPQARVMLETERLSATYSEQLGTRSLDILHVAMALTLGSKAFLTFDQRQSQLAVSASLQTPAI
jgi:predicted nucleic acid-binding protein